MTDAPVIAVIGTLDSKGEEHLFLKESIQKRGLRAVTVNVGTKSPPRFEPDFDLYSPPPKEAASSGRDQAIAAVRHKAGELVASLYLEGRIHGAVSAGGGTGTHLSTGVMRVLPMGVPKVMVSTVASRDMKEIVGTKDMTMIHSVVDLLGVNSISGSVLDKAAAAVCAMAQSHWEPKTRKKRIALTMFGFITEGAEHTKAALEEMGYEVVAFHANGTGGAAMEELAREGYFHGILDLATHELADTLMGGYCAGLGPDRLKPVPGDIPRLVIPGGLDCAVLEFTRDNIPEPFRARKTFFYDFRSAVRLDEQETRLLADQLAGLLNLDTANSRVLIPMGGWSEADMETGPLYDPRTRDVFLEELQRALDPGTDIRKANLHINDSEFARLAAEVMDEMVTASEGGR